MKKISLSTLLSLIAIFSIMGVTLAATNAVPGTGWWSAELIQNVTSSSATVTITLYDSASSNTYSKGPDSIAPGQSKLYQPGDFPSLPVGFQGSGVVQSTGDLRSLVSVTNRATGGLGDPASPQFAVASYQGTSAPGTTLRFPVAKYNVTAVGGNRTTTFFVQNSGTQPATATATFIMPKNGTPTNYNYTTPSIGVGKMVVFSPSDARDAANTAPQNNTTGSLTVTSAQLLAGTVLEHKHTETHATLLFSTRAFTPSDYDTFFYTPSIKNSYANRSSTIYVQNVAGGNVNITVTYKGTSGGGSTCGGQTLPTSQNNVPTGQMRIFDAAAVIPSGCLAAAEISATGNIVAMANEYFTDAFLNANPSIYQQGTSYSGAPAKNASHFWTMPLYKEDSFSKQTGAILQNVEGTNATNVVIKFIGVVNGNPTTYTTLPQTIPAGGSIVLFDVRNRSNFFSGLQMTPAALGCVNTVSGCGANGLFALTISSDKNLVVIANESTYPISVPRIIQDKNQYEGFNVTALP